MHALHSRCVPAIGTDVGQSRRRHASVCPEKTVQCRLMSVPVQMCAAAGLAVGEVTDHDLRVSILGAANDAD